MFLIKNQGLCAANIKAAVALAGRGAEVLRDVAGLTEEVLDRKHHPCPNCGGTDRFRVLDTRTGDVFCNQGCWDGHKRGDVFAVVKALRGVSFREALGLVAEYIGMGGGLSPFAGGVPPAQAPKGKPVKVTHYDYPDGAGEPYIRVGRRDYADKPKDFTQSRWDAARGVYTPGITGLPRVPFNAVEVKEAGYIYFVEGEKCAVAMENHLRETGKLTPDVAVTCVPCGTNGWKPELGKWFVGKTVYILPDNDEPGYKFAWDVKTHIERAATEAGRASIVIIFQWPPGTPPKWDIADELESRKGVTRDRI